MLSKDQIKSMLVFDLEACGQTHTLNELNPRLAEIFTRRTYPKIKEDGQDENEAFMKNCSLYAEYGRVLCGSFAMIKFDKEVPTISIVSIAEEDESILLNKISKLINDFQGAFINTSYPGQLCGFNIKGWDIPFLGKRYIANRIVLPKLLDVADKKPWEVPHYDLSDTWSFGQRKSTSLELILATLDIPTSKDDINGSEVHNVYHMSKNKKEALKRISTYCDKDTIATCKLLLRLNNIQDVEDVNIKIQQL